MAKQIFYDEDARKRILGGAEVLYKAVSPTMGLGGRAGIIGRGEGYPPLASLDGLAVANAVDIPVLTEETLGYREGIEYVRDAARRLNDVMGGCRTTAVVLCYNILKEADKLITANHNPHALRREMETFSEKVIAKLDKITEPIHNNKERMAQLATVSSRSSIIGEEVAKVFDKVGKDSVITVEEGRGLVLDSQIVEGFTFSQGFVSPRMITDIAREEAIIEEPAILITNKKLTDMHEVDSLLDALFATGKKDLVVIAEEIDGPMLLFLIVNRMEKRLKTLAVKAPAYGELREDTLEDLAILTGGKVLTDQVIESWEEGTVDLTVFGKARRVISTRTSTTVIEGRGQPRELKARLNQLTSQIKNASSPYEKEKLQKRRAALQAKVAIIRAGGASETEIKQKKPLVEDAVASVRAALEEGIVPGGGITLLNIATKFKPTTLGGKLLATAFEDPFKILLSNCGLNPYEWLPLIKNSSVMGEGLDLKNPTKIVDLKDAGIVEATKALKEALRVAVSIAGTFMTMGPLFADIPEVNKEVGMP